jgi:5-hydroxyisourate hydrolase
MITTHVLDTARGRPAAGVGVTLERQTALDRWERAGRGRTDEAGRLQSLVTDTALPGVYRMVFETGTYFRAHGMPVFYPLVSVMFEVAGGETHYHVPLLLSPFGYSTYRGS